jgi:phospholipid transport system substrate-binding protein
MTIKGDTGVFTHAVMLFVLVVFLSSTICAESQPVTDSLKGTLDKIIEVLNDQSLQTPAKKKERRDILINLVKERFDEEEFARRALGIHWRERTNEERKEFVEVFSDLLQDTYLDKIDTYLAKAGSFSPKNIRYLNETVKGKYVIVATKILTSDDAEIPVLYLFKNKEGNWLVCDVAIEGVSIAKNYRAQFQEILANSSFKELLARLKSKTIGLTEQKK